MHRLSSSVMLLYQFPKRQALMIAKIIGGWHFKQLPVAAKVYAMVLRERLSIWLEQ